MVGEPVIHFRPAERGDAASLAVLIDMAGEGIPLWVWSGMADDTQSPMEVGRMRAAREEGGFSYRNAEVLTVGGEIAGMVLGYRLDDPYQTGDMEEMPEPFRPLVELESFAPGSWYLNAMAVFDEFQGQGHGRRLVKRAEARAVESDATEISLIMAEENTRPARLYRAAGFEERARRPVISYPGARHGGDWILMVKSLETSR